ncbi:MAG: hypothetical protein QM392_06820 [Bacillota bacterium]|jgi:hypothetical protein|nr:hypothetical protein [Bacillota bacterium]
MPLFNDLERVKLRFIQTCEELVAQGRLDESEFQEILQLLDAMDGYDDQQLRKELSRISKGLSDLLE